MKEERMEGGGREGERERGREGGREGGTYQCGRLPKWWGRQGRSRR